MSLNSTRSASPSSLMSRATIQSLPMLALSFRPDLTISASVLVLSAAPMAQLPDSCTGAARASGVGP
jgi:hypothetical protein